MKVESNSAKMLRTIKEHKLKQSSIKTDCLELKWHMQQSRDRLLATRASQPLQKTVRAQQLHNSKSTQNLSQKLENTQTFNFDEYYSKGGGFKPNLEMAKEKALDKFF